jgi:hypothetical protein
MKRRFVPKKNPGCPAWIIEGVRRKHQEAIAGQGARAENASQGKPEAQGPPMNDSLLFKCWKHKE